MVQLLHHPDHLVGKQIAMVLNSNFQTVLFDSGNVPPEIHDNLRHLYHSLGAHTRVGKRMGMLHVGRIFHQFAAQLVSNLQGVLNGAVDSRIRGGVEGNIQLQIQAQPRRLFLDRCQMCVGEIVVQIYQCHMNDLNTLFHTHIHQFVQVNDLLKGMGLSFALKAPTLTQTAEVQGIGVHTQLEFTVCLFSSNHVDSSSLCFVVE